MTNRYRQLFLAASLAVLATQAHPAFATDDRSLAGTYRGFLAFDFKGMEVREWMMVSFHGDGTATFGAEEGHDEPVDPGTGRVTRNDIESASLGAWRSPETGILEFGTQQFRAGSGFCKPVNQHAQNLLPTCSFILTARLRTGATVRGQGCDLGGTGGGFSIQTVDGSKTVTDPLGLGLKLDYCLQRMSVDKFLELAPLN